MFFSGDPVNKGRCPASGSHEAQGFLFVLTHSEFPHPSITLKALQDANEGRFLEVAGLGFTPSQIVKLDYQINTANIEGDAPSGARKSTHNSSFYMPGGGQTAELRGGTLSKCGSLQARSY